MLNRSPRDTHPPHPVGADRSALVVAVLSLLAAALLVAGVVATIHHLADRHLTESARRSAQGWGQQLAGSVPDLDLVIDGGTVAPAAQDHLAALRSTPGLLRFRLFDAEGRLVLDSQSLGTRPDPATADPAWQALARQSAEGASRAVLFHGTDGLLPDYYALAWAPLPVSREHAGAIQVELDRTEEAQQVLASFRRASAVATAGVLLSLGVAVLLWRERARRARRAQDELRFLAAHDALTGALLHGPFRARLQSACAEGRPLVLMCLDFDGFGEINRRHGHVVGDELLRQSVQRMRQALRDGDLVARLAGDRFAIVLAGAADGAAATALMQRLQAQLSAPHRLPGLEGPVRLSACLGAALRGTDGDDAAALLRHAEQALERAKAAGAGHWNFYDPVLDQALQDRRELAHDLREALERGALELHFQPVWADDGERLAGYEALARWRHPVRGFVPPAQFVPLAEQHGLVDPLGRWVLQAACTEAARWPAPLSVAVNLSPAQFRHGDALVQEVERALRDSGLPATRLELEITESLLLQDTEQVLQVLHALHRLGVRIAMDDFGTGYSSLAYLWRFPFDKLKIDRAFTQGLATDPRVGTVVRSIVTLAHSLAIRVNAEGVETPEQRQLLVQHGCDELQGYLLGRPMPADQLPHRQPAEATEAADTATEPA